MNDNTKLSVKNYRNIIYKEIEEKKILEEFTDARLEINLDPLNNSKPGSSGKTTTHPK